MLWYVIALCTVWQFFNDFQLQTIHKSLNLSKIYKKLLNIYKRGFGVSERKIPLECYSHILGCIKIPSRKRFIGKQTSTPQGTPPKKPSLCTECIRNIRSIAMGRVLPHRESTRPISFYAKGYSPPRITFTASLIGPSKRRLPRSRTTPRSQIFETKSRSWLTTARVLPASHNS